MDELSQTELLKLALENGIVDINTITKQVEMNERKNILKCTNTKSGKEKKIKNGIHICRIKKKGGD